MVNDTDEDSLFRNEYCVPPQSTGITYIKEHQVGDRYLFKFQCNTLFTRTDGPDEGEVQCMELDNLNVRWSEVGGPESLPQCVFHLYTGILLGVSIFLLLLSLIFIFLYCRNRTESLQKVKRLSELAGFDNYFSHHSDDGNQPRYHAYTRSRSGSLQPQPIHSPQPQSRSGSLQPQPIHTPQTHRSPNEPLPPTPGRRHSDTMSVISDSSNIYVGADSDQEDRLDSLPPMPAPNLPGAHSGLDDDYMCSNTSGPNRLNMPSYQQDPGPSNATHRKESWKNRLSTGIKRTLSTFRPKLAQNPTFSAEGKHNSYDDEEEDVGERRAGEIALPVRINLDDSLDSDAEQGDKRESHM